MSNERSGKVNESIVIDGGREKVSDDSVDRFRRVRIPVALVYEWLWIALLECIVPHVRLVETMNDGIERVELGDIIDRRSFYWNARFTRRIIEQSRVCRYNRQGEMSGRCMRKRGGVINVRAEESFEVLGVKVSSQ